jgi:hypothetical protein
MRGLARRLAVYALCAVAFGTTGCAARAKAKQQYAMPETTTVKLKEPCRLNNKGLPAKPCTFVMVIRVVKVQ